MSRAMDGPSGKPMRSGGALLAFAILAGVLAGTWLGQPSLGFLAGLGAGLALLALVWLRDRR